MTHYLVAGRLDGPVARGRLEQFLAAAGPTLAMAGQRLDLRVVDAAGAFVAAWSANDLPEGDDALADHIRTTTGARLVASGRGVELVTGAVTARTWWRARVGEVAIATTSLRLAAFCLGDVEVDEEAAAWMMAAGSLGPSASWDRRVRQIPPLATYVVPTGELRLASPLPEPAATAPGAPEAFERELDALVGAALAPLVADRRRWVLPLSGGVDSRGLAILADGALETVTQGPAGSDREEWTDAAIAAALSDEFGWRHRFVAHPAAEVTAEVLLDNFCRASECRTDHVAGYADGMATYEDLVARGLRGLVRGDEAFGWNRRTTDLATRISLGVVFAADLDLPDGLADALAPLSRSQQPPHAVVLGVRRRLAAYRDELYRAYRVPAVLAPLLEIKSNYFEVATPLLDDDVVRFAAGLPDALRTDKRFWAQFVASRSREIPYARRRSASRLDDVLGRRDVDGVVRAALASGEPERAGVPSEALALLSRASRVPDDSARRRHGRSSAPAVRRTAAAAASAARAALPQPLRRELEVRREPDPTIGRAHAAFRAFLCGRAVALLDDAAAAGRRAAAHHGGLGASPGGGVG